MATRRRPDPRGTAHRFRTATRLLSACRASGDLDLAALAREFQSCTALLERPAPAGPAAAAPADADTDEEGSSVPGALSAPSRFGELADPPPPPRRTDTISDSGFPPLDPIGQPLTPAPSDGPLVVVILSDEEAEAIDRAARQAGWPGPGLRRGP